MNQETAFILRTYVEVTQPLDDACWQAFSASWEPFAAKRRQVLTFPGDKERYLYFVLSGSQRLLAHSHDREATLLFSYAPSFGGVLDSLLLQCPAAYTYETITASTFLRLSGSRLLELADEHPAIQRLIRKGLAAVTSGLLERLTELQVAPAEQRFRNLLRRSPHILQEVPHKYLANYIGIDPSNFSKFLNNIRI